MIFVYPPIAAGGATSSPATKRRRQTITASGNFTVPTGITQLKVKLVGGGGSGAVWWGVSGGNSPDVVACGGAGGGIFDSFLDVTPGQVLTATVGAGGAAVSTSAYGGVAGNNGSATSLASLSVPGGQGGSATVAATTTSTPGNFWGGRGSAPDQPAMSGRDGYAGGGGGIGGFQTSADSYRAITPTPGLGGGPGTAAPLANGTTTGVAGRTNSGSGGGATGIRGASSTGYSFTIISGAGAAGVIVLEWEEPVS